MSDTPRTDASTRMAFSGEYMVPIEFAQKLERDLAQSKQANAGLMRACDNLEREIADAKETIAMLEISHGATMLCHEAQMNEVTKQRDALADAGNRLLDSLYSQDWRKLPAIRSMRKALAATKGESHE